MRIILFLSALLLCSCSANWHLKKAINKGLKPEVTKQIVHDTVTVTKINDKKDQSVRVDTVMVEKDCDELIKAETPKEKKKALNDLQKNLCPTFKLDTTYQVKIKAQGKEYEFPIRIKIDSGPAGTHYSAMASEMEIPIVKEETTEKFVAKYGIQWYWLIVAILGGFIIGQIINASLSFKRRN